MQEPTQYGFYVDTTKCSGCKTCQVACKDRSDIEVGKQWRRTYEYCGGSWTEGEQGTYHQDVFAYYISISCNHCSNPVCVKACPTGAMYKERSTGLVKVNQDLCIGCESCARACPYDAPQIDPQRKVMTKCDGCSDRVAKGLKPSCVMSCPQRALDFALIDELKQQYGNDSDISGLPSSSITHPNLVLKVHAKSGQSGDIINITEV